MNLENKKVIIIGIAGASGSGKSCFASKLQSHLECKVLLITQDSYYKQQSFIPLAQREQVNYDHPDALDSELFVDHIKILKSGHSINQPIYDFTVHDRKKEIHKTDSADIIILDGILLFVVPALNEIIEYKIFIDTPLDVCFIRRLQRDMNERGRSAESVIKQYLTTVRPMYLKYVLPSKQQADLIINGEKSFILPLKNIIKIIEQKRT